MTEIKSLVQGIESAMNEGVNPAELAGTIARIGPPDQLIGFARTPTGQLAEQLGEVVPDSLLTTYNGRQYLGKLQQAILQVLGQPTS
jgi:hypothetical protein